MSEELSDEDLRWLARYARDERAAPAPLPVLARLEQQQLLMHGWDNNHVVTDRGRELLRTRGLIR